MDNNISFTNTKDTEFEFELSIEGLSDANAKVRFVIDTPNISFSFACKPLGSKMWSVIIPAMSHIERTTFPFHIEVIAEGYYFEPLKGVASVVASPELYVSTPVPTTARKPEVNAPTPKPTNTASPVVSPRPSLFTPKTASPTKDNAAPTVGASAMDDIVKKIISSSEGAIDSKLESKSKVRKVLSEGRKSSLIKSSSPKSIPVVDHVVVTTEMSEGDKKIHSVLEGLKSSPDDALKLCNNYDIIISHNPVHNGFWFAQVTSENKYDDNDGGDGEIYKTKEAAAKAAVKYYKLLSKPKSVSIKKGKIISRKK